MRIITIEEAVRVSPLGDEPGLRWMPGLPTIASPMRQAVDADNWIVEADGIAPVFLKIYSADARDGLDLAAAWAGATAAGTLGVAPKARFFLPEQGVIATTFLPPPWRPALLHDLTQPAILEGAITAKRRFHTGAPLSRAWDVFAETEILLARARAAVGLLPSDIDDLAAWSRQAAAAVRAAGVDLRPCHNDGGASSMVLGPDGAVQLVDFDQAGQSDALYDLALLLNEASAFGDPWSRGLEVYAGAAEPRSLDRCRLYAVADDILCGLWGWLLSATSPRRSVEFLKYGEWRLLRARMALREAGFSNRLRRL